MKRVVITIWLFLVAGMSLAQKPDTSIAVNGWKVHLYSAEIISAKTYFDLTNSYHGVYSQWFEAVRSKPEYAYFKQYSATFRKKLNKRISKWDYLAIAVKTTLTEPKVSTITQTPNLEIAYSNKGQISTFQTIINTGNDKWLDIALFNNFTSLDSIDCIYLRVSGNFLKTKVQVDYLRFGKNNVGTVIATIDDFEDAQIVGLGEKENIIPDSYELSQNYPNPFNPETTISYKIQAASQVSLKVYDVLGREVATLVNEYQQAGAHNCKLRIENGELPSTVYFYRLEAGNPSASSGHGFVQTKKMILLK